MKDDKIYLIHILECIEKTERFLENKKHLKDSEMVDDAIIRNLQIMAESTQRLSEKIKINIHDIPWRDISDFRNKLVHDYLGIDLEIIYDVIENELPNLKKKILEILQELENSKS
ncbi:MAG: HepT-like ribonuclease domain-containing protein [Pseudomonadota bacterium]